MMDAAAFFAAILADPEDDTARLVFADWLEERCDPRGEFIRLQIALASPGLPVAEFAALLVRSHELLATHESEWVRPLRTHVKHWTFVRGFVEGIDVEAPAFLASAATLFQLAPIRRLKIRGLGRQIAALARIPHLERLSELDVSGNDLGDTGVEILVRDARLPRLSGLDLGMNLIDIEGVRALAAAPQLAPLKTLVLDHNHVRDMGVYALASSPYLTGLTTLRLDYCDVSLAGVRYLAETTRLGQLQVLDLSHNEMGDAGLRTLARAKKLPDLCELRLRGCEISALGARALGESSLAGRLSRLDLRDNPIARLQQETLQKQFGSGVCVF